MATARTTRTTKSGFVYYVTTAQEEAKKAQGGYWTDMCPVKRCALIVQGGPRAMAEHRRVVHPEL